MLINMRIFFKPLKCRLGVRENVLMNKLLNLFEYFLDYVPTYLQTSRKLAIKRHNQLTNIKH